MKKYLTMETNINSLINEIIIPKVLNSDNELLNMEIEQITNDAIIFTNLNKIKLIIKDKTSDEQKEACIVLKLINNEKNNVYSIESMFYNEGIFYSEVVPIFEQFANSKLFPKFYCYNSTYKTTEQSYNYLVIEFLNNYEMYKKSLFLPVDHIELTLRKLGEFHGYSYILREKNINKFNELKEKFIEVRYQQKMDPTFIKLLKIVLNRGFEYLPVNIDKYPSKIIEKFKRIFEDPLQMGLDIIKPKNHLAVICHGDFNRNNVMYAYDNAKVIDMKFIDFQTPRYSSPATDLAFFLSMNIPCDILEANFIKWFRIYHQSIINTIKKWVTTNINLNKYSFELFLHDYTDHAVLGYLITSYFMPVMENQENVKLKEWADTDFEILKKDIYTNFGSDAVLKHTGCILKFCLDLYKKQYFT